LGQTLDATRAQSEGGALMTRRDYVLISKLLAAHKFQQVTIADHHTLCYNFARALAQENPRFNVERFMEACGTTPPFSRAAQRNHNV
jgi:hypothetical protein